MTKTKTFDCVEMKHAIQAKHAEEYAGMTNEAIAERIQQKLATSNHPVAVWYAKMVAEKDETRRKS